MFEGAFLTYEHTGNVSCPTVAILAIPSILRYSWQVFGCADDTSGIIPAGCTVIMAFASQLVRCGPA